MSYPVVGVLTASYSILFPELATGFDEFDTPTVGGLARVTAARLDILALRAKQPGRGDVGRFLGDCQRQYETVCVWEIMSGTLDGMLERRGFVVCVEWMDGELTTGRRWEASHA